MRVLIAPLLLGTLIGIHGAPTAASDTIRFDRDVRPILSDKCFYCHGPDEQHREAGLRLDIEDRAREMIGDSEMSELVARITTEDRDQLMPPVDSHKKLTRTEVETLKRWVDEGGRWTEHWSFVAPAKAEQDGTEANLIDRFVRDRLKSLGIEPMAAASREKLIRRVSFDLTGMPPSLPEIDAFVGDTSTNAYEKVVDRLLASSRYGQRMALKWMDAARYGDTSVYHADGPRDMWAWRDAIVDAYNDNLPFDQFTIYQLAGDLIPEATDQQKLLAGFNRNNGTTDEGGAIAEEYRVEYAVDRVKTTSTVWLGLTMECAQCHDHKYDPISQEDYYKFYAFFNISRDGGMQTRNGNAEPKMDVHDPEKQKQIPPIEQRLTSLQQRLNQIESESETDLKAWIESQAAVDDRETATAGPVVQILISEGSGNELADTVAADRVATVHGTANWVQTRDDWGLQLDGGVSIDIGDVGNFERDDQFSYGGWVKPQPDSGAALLARMDSKDNYRGYDLFLANQQVAVHIIHSWQANAIKVTTKKKLEPDQWYHIFATYDGSSKASGIHIYVNGQLWETDVNADSLSETIRTDKSLLIGARHSGSRLKGVVDEVQLFDRHLSAEEVQRLAETSPIPVLLSIDSASRTVAQHGAIKRYYLTTQHPEYQASQQEAAQLEQQLVELRKPLTSVMIMGDLDQPRETFILNRGSYDSPTDQKVLPGTPSILPPMEAGLPATRLGLAQWLFQDEHPLTARVAVNRYWQMLFGHGLVSTAEDFGAQGEFPTHPELLNALAVDFRDSGWDVKRMIKQMVMSKTYQQSSHATREQYRTDPNNRNLARGPRFRLQAEFIRDTALQLSELLVDTVGGPGVKPYQPAGLWAEVGLGGNPKFEQDHGDKLYRRSLYTYWKRSAPPPSMQIFDAPTREKCTIQRPRTNTPLQALVVLNDPQFVEASRHFASRIVRQGGDSTESRIRYGFRLATARRPTEKEVKILTEVLESAFHKYSNDTMAAEQLLAVGESNRDATLPSADHAAWTIVASTVLNLDETLTRE